VGTGALACAGECSSPEYVARAPPPAKRLPQEGIIPRAFRPESLP